MPGVYLGTSDFAATVLEILAASDQRPALVVTLPDRKKGRGRKEQASPVAVKAGELEIPVLKSGNVNEDGDRERILEAGGEWASICAFGQLIKEPLLSELPMLNVHPSLLPRWRGAAPVERAIMEGDSETGVCVMRLVAGLDSGPVALRETTFVVVDLDDGLPPGPPVDVIVCHRFRDRRLDRAITDRLAPGGLLAISVLSAVGAAPGPFRAEPGELRAAFAKLTVIATGEGDGEAWLLARRAPLVDRHHE